MNEIIQVKNIFLNIAVFLQKHTRYTAGIGIGHALILIITFVSIVPLMYIPHSNTTQVTFSVKVSFLRLYTTKTIISQLVDNVFHIFIS